jgi:SNF2 family DNA or RNA helicase
METEILKWNTGKYLVPVQLTYTGSRIEFKFKYNKKIMEEIKNMEGHQWHGYDESKPRKIWSIKDSSRNRFHLSYIKGENPYAPYDVPIKKFTTNRPLMKHQFEMTGLGLAVNHCIWAAEMGVGKTLSAIEVMDYAYNKRFITDNKDAWYVGPRSGVRAVGRELIKWDSKIRPKMFTYNGLVSTIRAWTNARPAPKVIILDESSKVKSPNAQRSTAALHIANAIRQEYGRSGYIIEMSGTPAPKEPTDWWHQCEIACPGFLREGDSGKFKRRLCLIEQRESMITGGIYPHIITWWDDENKCKYCGEFSDHPNHFKGGDVFGEDVNYHRFEKSFNEVAYLNERMKGLVLVLFKKDCMELPEKRYIKLQVKSKPETLRAAALIRKIIPRAAQVSMLLRELSDGFQYKEKKIGEQLCSNCHGEGKVSVPIDKDSLSVSEPWSKSTTEITPDSYTKTEIVDCLYCGGKGQVSKMERLTEEIGTPKDQIFIDELDEHDDIGRYIVWGGFTATVDRLEKIAHQQGWATLKIDGRGFNATLATGEIIDSDIFLDAMDASHKNYEKYRRKYPKICIVGNPEAGGMALTFTASPTMLYFSNSFKGEARMQSEDRGHRPGMDMNIGLTIKDLIHLPIDLVVLNNVQKKKDMQAMTMGDLQNQLDKAEKELKGDLI